MSRFTHRVQLTVDLTAPDDATAEAWMVPAYERLAEPVTELTAGGVEAWLHPVGVVAPHPFRDRATEVPE